MSLALSSIPYLFLSPSFSVLFLESPGLKPLLAPPFLCLSPTFSLSPPCLLISFSFFLNLYVYCSSLSAFAQVCVYVCVCARAMMCMQLTFQLAVEQLWEKPEEAQSVLGLAVFVALSERRKHA